MIPKPPAPGSGSQFRKPLRNWARADLPDDLQSPQDRGLAGRLVELAGAEIDDLEVDDESLAGWNATVSSANRESFEHRILLGIGINLRKPSWGKVGEYQAEVGGSLDRSERWVQSTMRVAAAVNTAFDDDVVLPVEICDIAWSSIPRAIGNIRNGRALDYKPSKADRAPTPEEQEDAVAKALQSLKKALEAVEDGERRAALAAEVRDGMEPYLEGADSEPKRSPASLDSHQGDRRAVGTVTDDTPTTTRAPATTPTSEIPDPEPEPRDRDPHRSRRPGRGRRRR